MMKTEMARLFHKELGITLNDGFWLVNNCIRDGILVGVDWKPKGKKKGKRWKNILWYIVMESAETVEKRNKEEKDRLNKKYGLTDDDWKEPLGY